MPLRRRRKLVLAMPPRHRLRADPSGPKWAGSARRECKAVAAALIQVPMAEPEAGSVLGQLANRGIDLTPAVSFVAQQAGRFLTAALDIPLKPEGPSVLTPIGPLARSALLCGSKLVSVCAPLCLETRQLGPARQLAHDVMIEGYIEQERRQKMLPSDPSAAAWTRQGRNWQLDRINGLRTTLGLAALSAHKISPRHVLVSDGAWIRDAQSKSASVRQLQGAALDEFEARMEWAWFRGSTITHGAPSFRAGSNQMSYVYIDGEEASTLLRCAAEMLVSATVVAGGTVLARAAPKSFDWNTGGLLPMRGADRK